MAPSKDHSIKYFALSHSTKRAQSNIISIKCVTFQSVYQRVTFDPVAWNYGFMKKIPESVAIMFSGSVHHFTSATLGLIFVCQHQILHQPWKNTDSCNIFATFQHPGDDDCGSNFLVVKEEEEECVMCCVKWRLWWWSWSVATPAEETLTHATLTGNRNIAFQSHMIQPDINITSIIDDIPELCYICTFLFSEETIFCLDNINIQNAYIWAK